MGWLSGDKKEKPVKGANMCLVITFQAEIWFSLLLFLHLPATWPLSNFNQVCCTPIHACLGLLLESAECKHFGSAGMHQGISNIRFVLAKMHAQRS